MPFQKGLQEVCKQSKTNIKKIYKLMTKKNFRVLYIFTAVYKKYKHCSYLELLKFFETLNIEVQNLGVIPI